MSKSIENQSTNPAFELLITYTPKIVVFNPREVPANQHDVTHLAYHLSRHEFAGPKGEFPTNVYGRIQVNEEVIRHATSPSTIVQMAESEAEYLAREIGQVWVKDSFVESLTRYLTAGVIVGLPLVHPSLK